ncbi:dimeric dihydrodiol dehydrogenase, putative [Talaromyces stipitatus ATCC 10500]|uniref:D-xylose 1-dehydrogenase (NADP(+), D-xylono-1,5-lactone-forming) n=1 Tax=Talaromyces stipitatus (strain ATCC 10500 / CBS 375.48 / QM 6759 / NRRL 1006) TaxID=441959 RepID=B8MLD4_TALSN|nr:dimeric dihydrodiol dehydrogenase, putative [Talaromyces stipitatus ATCC 10500]EED15049.1 dimeric dihydrodiol dehydrogenase, putative [Talaromyces stipitatus ATCC 10500]
MVHNTRWGILATGGIAKAFVKDLLKNPQTRNASDITHTVTAVASSSSSSRAQEFITDLSLPGMPKAYGSYEELVNDPNVDVIYIATPHSHHYQNARLALEAGKHVLCEKAFTVNAAQAKILVDIARKKNLFLMEAVWTRFFPLSVQVRDIIRKGGEIGEVVRVLADLSIANADGFDVSSRMVNLDLAGGALLDLGIYSLTWVFQTLYHTLPPSQRKPPSTIQSSMTKYPATGADEDTTILLTFPTTTPADDRRASHGIATTAFAVHSHPRGTPSIRIQGTKGEIQIFGPAFRPVKYRVVPVDEKKEIREWECEFPDGGHGMYWEADEVARCLRDGKLESERMPWEESIVIMEVMDEVRRQNGLVYPEKIESVEYPVAL